MSARPGEAAGTEGAALAAESLEVIRNSLECLDQGIGVFDSDLRLTAVNRKFLDLAGMGADELRMGTSYEDFIRGGAEKGAYGEDDAEARVRECVDGARRSAPCAFEWLKADGGMVEFRGHPLPGGGLAATFAGAAPRRTDEAAAPVIGERLRRILEGSPIAVGITAPGDRLLFRNERWSEMAGIAHGEGVPVDLRAMFKNPSDREFLIDELRAKGFVRDVEMEFVRVGGEAMWVLVSMQRMVLDGEPVTMGWYSDITERKRGDDVLRANEAQQRKILESSPIAVSITAPGDRLLFWNDRWSEMAGVPHEDGARVDLRAMFKNPADREFLAKELRRKEVVRDAEMEFVRADGTPMWVLVSMRRMMLDDEPATFGWFSDITDRKRAEEEIARLNRRNELLLDAAGEGIYGLDPEGRTTFVNPAAARMTGWAPEELIGEFQHDILHHTKPDGSRYPREECHIYAAIKDGRVRNVDDEMFWRRDGTGFPVEYTSTPIEEGGKPVGAVVVFRDITERKRAEEALRRAHDELELRVEERTAALAREVEEHKRTDRALRESEERLRDLAEAGSDWFWEMDSDLRVTHVSSSIRKVLGIEPDDMIGKSRTEMAAPGADSEMWKAHLDDLRQRRPFRDFQYTLLRPDGTAQYVKTSGKPVFDEAGAFTGYRGTGSSVTAQVEAEMRAAKAQEQLVDAIESLHDAFILFDAEDRFVLCNSKYREYYPIAARLLKPGLKFHDFIEESAEMGELTDTGQPNEEVVEDRVRRFREAAEPFFQQLQNGRWVRVSEHRTSDGGTVSIRTDVTDLRRAEEEWRAAKEQAEYAQDQLVTAIESLSEAFLLFDADDRFVLCNTKYKEFYPSIAELCVPGVSFEEILRAFTASGADEAAQEDPEGWVRERMAKHREAGAPFLQRLSDGRWLQISERRTNDGGTVSLRTDLTDLVEAERRVERAQAQLSDAIESLSDAFILFDAEDRYVIGNDKVREIYAGVADLLRPGVTFEEMLRKFVRRGGITDAHEDPEGWIEERLAKHRNPGDPHVYRLNTGRWLRISEHKTADGGTVSIRTDITPLVEAEMRATEAQEQLSDAIESISEAFILFDADDRFVLCNSKFREYYKITAPLLRPGISFREMVRTAVERGELLGIEQPLDEWLEARMEEHRNPAQPHTHHLNSGRWMRVSDGRTKSNGFVSVRTDITDLRRAEEDLRAANEELEAFAYSVAHDLRAPLRTMDGFCQALLEDYGDGLEPEGQDYLRRVRAGSQRMALLIDELLELSRVSRADFERKPADLSEIAGSIAEDLRNGAPERRVAFDIHPDMSVYGDVRLLRVLLENLIGNAWKFTSKHSQAKVEIGVTSHGGMKTYFVRDDGAGFDMKYANKLFQPFQRLHTAEEFEGTGIGLATVARVVARHGGRVWAQSGIEEGTSVYFTIGTRRRPEHE